MERVTLLGDSFIFGAPVAADATIGAQLQALAGGAYEVVNLGVPGYGTGQQYLLVEELLASGYRLGRKLILAFFTNDLQDNLGVDYSTLARNRGQPAFSVRAGHLEHSAVAAPRPRQRTDGRSWLERSLFLQFLRAQAEAVLVSHPRVLAALEAVGLAPALPRTPGIVAGWYGPQWESMWKATEAIVEHVVAKLWAAPEPPQVFIAFVPSPFQVQESFMRTIAAAAQRDERFARFLGDPDRPQRLLAGLARRLEVPFIDLTGALRAAARDSMLYFPREGHFNEAGSAVAARVIFERAIQNPH